MQPNPTWPSINRLTQPLLENLKRDADALRLQVMILSNGTTLIDAGIDARGGLEAGRRIAEICLGGLGHVALHTGAGKWPLALSVHAANPVLACLGSQYAGWSLSHGEGKGAFHALGSGPGRALAQKEALFAELGYRDSSASTCLVLEVDQAPPLQLIEKVSRDCQVAPEQLTFILTPTRSLAGVVQIVARVLENGRWRSVCMRQTQCWHALAASMRAGAWPTARARVRFVRSAPDPAAHLHKRKRCSRNWAIATARRQLV